MPQLPTHTYILATVDLFRYTPLPPPTPTPNSFLGERGFAGGGIKYDSTISMVCTKLMGGQHVPTQAELQAKSSMGSRDIPNLRRYLVSSWKEGSIMVRPAACHQSLFESKDLHCGCCVFYTVSCIVDCFEPRYLQR